MSNFTLKRKFPITTNPTGTATGTLEKLGIGDDIYEIGGIPNITLNNKGTASATTYAYQALTVGSNSYTVSGSIHMEQSVSLSTSGVTAVTFSNSIITVNSLVDAYCSDSGLDYESISVAAGSCVVTLPKVDSAKNVAVRIYIR